MESIWDSFTQYLQLGEAAILRQIPVTEPISFLILPFLPGAAWAWRWRGCLGFGALGCLYGGRLANLLAYAAAVLRGAAQLRTKCQSGVLVPWIAAADVSCTWWAIVKLRRRAAGVLLS